LKEIEDTVDIDGSKKKVYENRKRRLGGRFARKAEEYRKRRAILRAERNQIRDSMEKDRAMGLTESPADVQDIGEIDTRMERLVELAQRQAEISGGIKPPRTDTEVRLQGFRETIPGFDPDDYDNPEQALMVARAIQAGTVAPPSTEAAAPEPGPPPPETEPKIETPADIDAILQQAKENALIPIPCDICSKPSPPGHPDPAKWVRSHKLGAHTEKRKRGRPRKEA
jgi:hypothetical protein